LSDDDIKLLREDVQAVKDEVIRHTMQFTDAEKAAFWPVYREYSQEQQVIAGKRFSIITEYAQNLDKMEDEKASSLTKRFFQIEDEAQALRQKYFSKFEKTLGAKRAAKFYQVDNRLTMIMNIQTGFGDSSDSPTRAFAFAISRGPGARHAYVAHRACSLSGCYF